MTGWVMWLWLIGWGKRLMSEKKKIRGEEERKKKERKKKERKKKERKEGRKRRGES